MEFQEALTKLVIHKPVESKKLYEAETERVAETVTTPKHHRWKISFYSFRSLIPAKPQQNPPPKEFLCPIYHSLMADPVIVSSGHTFERACVQACKTLNFIPILKDHDAPDFSTVISNLALKSTILHWCAKHYLNPPKPLDYNSADKLVRTLMASRTQNPSQKFTISISEKELIQGVKETPNMKFNHAVSELTRRSNHFSSSSDDSLCTSDSTPPLQLATRPSSYSSSSSSEIEILNPSPISTEEEELLTKMTSQQVFEVEEAVISLRNITRSREDSRAHLCTSRLLSAIRSLIFSRYSSVQVNSIAALVNLSLEKVNKVKIVRSGIVPPLINVLTGGFPEAQEHASSALFSLALDDQNKLAIGVLGGLGPLLHSLRSESDATRHDSAMALYHLTLVQSNRDKFVKVGAVNSLLGMAKSGHMTGRVILILGNLALSPAGRAAMLGSGGVECFVELLRRGELESAATREQCVAALDVLSQEGLRFKGLAKAAGAVEVLAEVEKTEGEWVRNKARRVLEMIRGREEEEDEEEGHVNWEELLTGSDTRC